MGIRRCHRSSPRREPVVPTTGVTLFEVAQTGVQAWQAQFKIFRMQQLDLLLFSS